MYPACTSTIAFYIRTGHLYKDPSFFLHETLGWEDRQTVKDRIRGHWLVITRRGPASLCMLGTPSVPFGLAAVLWIDLGRARRLGNLVGHGGMG